MKSESGGPEVSVQLHQGAPDPNNPNGRPDYEELFSVATAKICIGKQSTCFVRVKPGEPFHFRFRYDPPKFKDEYFGTRDANAFGVTAEFGEKDKAAVGTIYLTNDTDLIDGGGVIHLLKEEVMPIPAAGSNHFGMQPVAYSFSIDGFPVNNLFGLPIVVQPKAELRGGGEGSGLEDLQTIDTSFPGAVRITVELVKLSKPPKSKKKAAKGGDSQGRVKALPSTKSVDDTKAGSASETVPAGVSCKVGWEPVKKALQPRLLVRSSKAKLVAKFMFLVRDQTQFDLIKAAQPIDARSDTSHRPGIIFVSEDDAAADPNGRLIFLESAATNAMIRGTGQFSNGPGIYLLAPGVKPAGPSSSGCPETSQAVAGSSDKDLAVDGSVDADATDAVGTTAAADQDPDMNDVSESLPNDPASHVPKSTAASNEKKDPATVEDIFRAEFPDPNMSHTGVKSSMPEARVQPSGRPGVTKSRYRKNNGKSHAWRRTCTGQAAAAASRVSATYSNNPSGGSRAYYRRRGSHALRVPLAAIRKASAPDRRDSGAENDSLDQ